MPKWVLPTILLMITGCGPHKPRDTTFTELAPATQPAALAQSEYRLQAGDVFDVKFFYQPELNEEATVRPDGNISLQLINEVHVVGMTPNELRRTLLERYAGQLRNPEVAIVLRQTRTSRVYVAGEVNTPGLVLLDTDLTALQAIMQAGGMKVTALTDNVVILRNQGTEKPLYITLDLKSDLELAGQRHDIYLQPRDIVFVPKTTISKMNDFVDQYIDKLIPVERSIGVYYNLDKTPK